MEFAFTNSNGGETEKKRRLDEDGTQFPVDGASSSGTTTHTEGGIHVQTALLKITDALENLELRVRHIETATYVTLSAPPDNVFLTGGLKATKDHKEIVDKQRREGKTPKERKEIGGPALYVGLKWMTICCKPEARPQFTLTHIHICSCRRTAP